MLSIGDKKKGLKVASKGQVRLVCSVLVRDFASSLSYSAIIPEFLKIHIIIYFYEFGYTVHKKEVHDSLALL